MIIRLDVHKDQQGWDRLMAYSGNLAFNVGANIGQAARALAPNFHFVVALEPCAESYEILAAEMPDNIICLPYAASDHEGTMTLIETERSIGFGELVSAGPALPMWGDQIGTRTVRCTTIDALTQTYGAPDLVQVDVEGAEVEVVAGAARTIATHHPNVHIEIHRAANEPAIREMLPGYDLEVLRHGDYVNRSGTVYRDHFWLVGEWRGDAGA